MTTTSARPAGSALRTAARHLVGRTVGHLLGLPAETTGYRVHRVRIPMRDGVELVADHYAPVATDPAGTLLVRGPYGRGFPFSLIFAMLYAARGYHVVLQSVRGTFGSGGVFEPMVREADDGADTAAWLRRQPWFTGRFGTIGVSYLGFTQWAMLTDPPPELAAAVIIAGPHDFGASAWGTGAFAVSDFLGWSDLVAHQEDAGRIRAAIRQLRAQRRVDRAAGQVPLGASSRALLGDRAPWYDGWLAHPDLGDPFWEEVRFTAALDRVQIPVLLVGGWQDLFLTQTLHQYRHLRDRGIDVALTVGPWPHTQLLTKGLGDITRHTLAWLDTHLGAVSGAARRAPVRVYVGGGRGWRDLPDWPPATTEKTLYLQPGGGLADAPPSAAAQIKPATFRFDPADPTPTIGGPMLSPDSGYRDDSRLVRRPDVLAFSGDPLAADLEVHGNPVVEVAHSSDNPHVDLFVRVSEVDARGRSVNVSDGYRRLAAATTDPQPVRLTLDAVAHRFRAGSRIRVLVAGGWYPRFARNLGTGEPVTTGRQMRSATHAVHFGASRLVLPVEAG
ncbi:CocE/NonD family hydrolase [Mycobacterium sp.]|uniref:CocE/NonD family hydrolase n=1 Tax=Mycobacterium sp. TaxID=1785 RepID=UPI001272FAF1|nr:CocE/NonD family hydrolase [Mycobacterium sp.]KAA8958347.1 MAG: CocE/NonD family hydrolase [Mycobacterium sp.]